MAQSTIHFRINFQNDSLITIFKLSNTILVLLSFLYLNSDELNWMDTKLNLIILTNVRFIISMYKHLAEACSVHDYYQLKCYQFLEIAAVYILAQKIGYYTHKI